MWFWILLLLTPYSMTPEDYCHHLAAPPGSDFRYSLLGLPPSQRQALTAIRAFLLETTPIAEQRQDSGVASAKLDWWRTEIGRLFAGEPQHPVTLSLQIALSQFNLPEEYFWEMLDGAAMDVAYNGYRRSSEFTLYLHRRGSIPTLLATEILTYQDRRATPRFAHEAGAMLVFFETLYYVRQHARQGRIYLPEEEMQRFGVHPSDLLAPQTSDRLRQLFAAQTEQIRSYYQRALKYLPVIDRHVQYSLLIRLELAMALLEEIVEDGYRLLEQRIRLTPLRKLWLAWRLREREKRRHRRLEAGK